MKTVVSHALLQVALLSVACLLSHFGALTAPLAGVLGTSALAVASVHVAQALAAVGAQRVQAMATATTANDANLHTMRTRLVELLQAHAPALLDMLAEKVARERASSSSSTTGGAGKT